MTAHDGPALVTTRGDLESALRRMDAAPAPAPDEVGRRRRAVVMTMGALHEGHLSLVRTAREVAEHVVVTIFVNPLQFGAGEDLDRYPRDLRRDLALLTGPGLLGAGDVVFAPERHVVYPDGDPLVRVSAGPLGTVLEGVSRPGHLDGVLTVVLKLLHLTRPGVAVFGQKDAQQLAAVTRMVRDLDVPVDIAAAPTVREADGLAMSSRNAYLSPEERARALVLSRALRAAEDAAAAGGGQAAVRAALTGTLDGAEIELEYAELVDPTSFARFPDPGRPADAAVPAELALAVVAARVGSTRLIDNAPIHVGGR